MKVFARFAPRDLVQTIPWETFADTKFLIRSTKITLKRVMSVWKYRKCPSARTLHRHSAHYCERPATQAADKVRTGAIAVSFLPPSTPSYVDISVTPTFQSPDLYTDRVLLLLTTAYECRLPRSEVRTCCPFFLFSMHPYTLQAKV